MGFFLDLTSKCLRFEIETWCSGLIEIFGFVDQHRNVWLPFSPTRLLRRPIWFCWEWIACSITPSIYAGAKHELAPLSAEIPQEMMVGVQRFTQENMPNIEKCSTDSNRKVRPTITCWFSTMMLSWILVLNPLLPQSQAKRVPFGLLWNIWASTIVADNICTGDSFGKQYPPPQQSATPVKIQKSQCQSFCWKVSRCLKLRRRSNVQSGPLALLPQLAATSTDILSNTSCCQIQIVLIIVTSSMTESPRQTNNAPRIEPCRKMTCNSTAVTVKGLFPSKGIYNPDREETQRNPIWETTAK